MAKTYACCTGIFNYVFNNQPFDALGSNLYFSLHSTSMNAGGFAGVEVNYNGYERQAVERSGWPIMGLGNVLGFPIDIEFPEVGAPFPLFALSWGIWTAKTGGTALYYGNLGTAIPLQQGVKPTIKQTSTMTES